MSCGVRTWVTGFLLCACTSAPLSAADYQLAKAETPPDGLPEAVAAAVGESGVRINGPQRELCQLWLAKAVPVAADFQPSAAVKYPFASGQLIGVLQVPRRSGLTDFRGNEIERGVYTLRYGRQPMDGNHIGTSDLADFLVAIPADRDDAPVVLEDVARLHELSAAASGTTHPAIFSLQPVAAAAAEPALTHDEAREFWILQVNLPAQQGGATKPLPLRVVIVGVSEG